MPPSMESIRLLLKSVNKTHYKDKLEKHEKFKQKAKTIYAKAMDPNNNLSKRLNILYKAWPKCRNSLLYKRDSAKMWEFLGDIGFELCEMPIAKAAYMEAAKHYTENDDKIREKLTETSKLLNLYIALDTNKLPLSIWSYVLRCISCGASGGLMPYRLTKSYTRNDGYTKTRVYSNIAVPLCEKCMEIPKYNAKKNIKYTAGGPCVGSGYKRSYIGYQYWQKFTILDKYKLGQISPEILNQFADNVKY